MKFIDDFIENNEELIYEKYCEIYPEKVNSDFTFENIDGIELEYFIKTYMRDNLEENLNEISKEQAKELYDGTSYIVYNPLSDSYKYETASKNDIAHNKYCYEKLKFYIGGKNEKIK